VSDLLRATVDMQNISLFKSRVQIHATADENGVAGEESLLSLTASSRCRRFWEFHIKHFFKD
jgi:hypothetical protein